MRKGWDTIRDIRLRETGYLTVPWLMELVRVDGSIVTSANVNIPETAVGLFSTAGFGRIPPKNLAVLIAAKFKDRIAHYPYNKLCDALSKDKGRFIKNKYQECSV